MLACWRADLKVKPEPVPNCGNLTERDPRLYHAERTGVHSKENDALGSRAVGAQIGLVSLPGINERVINAGDRRSKLEPCDGPGKFPGRRNQSFSAGWSCI